MNTKKGFDISNPVFVELTLGEDGGRKSAPRLAGLKSIDLACRACGESWTARQEGRGALEPTAVGVRITCPYCENSIELPFIEIQRAAEPRTFTGRQYQFRHEGERYVCAVQDTGIGSGTAPITRGHWHIEFKDSSFVMRACTDDEISEPIECAAFEAEVIAFVRSRTDGQRN